MLLLIFSAVIFGLIGALIGKNKEAGAGVGFLLGFLLSLIGIIIVLCLRNKDTGYDTYYPVPESYPNTDITTIETISKADELLKWHSLREKGAITDEEFERMKSKLL